MSISFLNKGKGGNTSNYNANIITTGTVPGMSTTRLAVNNLITDLPDTITLPISVKELNELFQNCYNLKKVPNMDTTKIQSMSYMFYNCEKITEIPQYNTGNTVLMSRIFFGCTALTKIPKLNAEKVNNIDSAFYNCYNLIDFGGLENLGKGYTSKSNYSSSYTLNISSCTKLTHDSLMNVINNLYDLNLTYNVAGGGTLYRQYLRLSTTSNALLSDEEKQIATDKGWDIQAL